MLNAKFALLKIAMSDKIQHFVTLKKTIPQLYRIYFVVSRKFTNNIPCYLHHKEYNYIKGVKTVQEEDFVKRLSELRIKSGVSARDMSLSIGLSESYINKIENGKALPSMQAFFYICEYLKITPKQFFDDGISSPVEMTEFIGELNKLTEEQFNNIRFLVKNILE